MPFTTSHPAAVLPLARRPLVASALVAGSMAPDLPYYLPLPVSPDTTHLLHAALHVDAVLALGLVAAFQLLFKLPVLALAPAALAGRLVPAARGFRVAGPVDAWWLVASAVLGTATHVVWDSFTHIDGAAAMRIGPLRESLFGVIGVYRALQYLSTLVGAVILLVWFRRWWRRTRPVPVPPALALPGRVRRSVLWAVAAASVAGALVKVATGDRDVQGFDLLRVVLILTALGAATGCAAALTAYSAGWRLWRWRGGGGSTLGELGGHGDDVDHGAVAQHRERQRRTDGVGE